MDELLSLLRQHEPRLGFGQKRLIAYGAGMALLQIQAVMHLPLEYIIDDTPGLAGKEINGLRVFHSSYLTNDRGSDDLLVIIFANTTRAILGIAQALNSIGFVWGKDYIDCSVLQYETMKSRMQDSLGISPSKELFERVRLLSLYSSLQNQSTIAGTWLFTELLDHVRSTGSFAECGVYNGGNAFVSLMCSARAAERRYHLLDSFEGFPEFSQHDPQSRRPDFNDVNLSYVRDVFGNFENVQLHKGYFNETLPSLSDEEFAVVYVDCDLYEPTIELCEFFFPRLSEGGCLLFHDYWVPENDPPHFQPFRGLNRAVGEFLGPDLDRLLVFPETTHAVLVK
jgi:hypothetical protein